MVVKLPLQKTNRGIQMPKIKETKKLNPYARKILVQFKVNADEMREVLKQAHGFTAGNISGFVRYAALNFKPRKEDFQK